MAIHWDEKQFADYQAQVRRMRGESDDGPGNEASNPVVDRHARTDRGSGGIGGGRTRHRANAMVQAPIRHEHIHTTRPALDAPRLTGRWLRLLCTVAALGALGSQVGWDVDVPPGALLVSVFWLVIAYATRRAKSSRGSSSLATFGWGALFGASVESMIHSAEELRR